MQCEVANAYKKSHKKDFSFLDVEIVDACYHAPAYADDVVQYAYDMTQKELVQAVEGFFHNMNTLQSRSGN